VAGNEPIRQRSQLNSSSPAPRPIARGAGLPWILNSNFYTSAILIQFTYKDDGVCNPQETDSLIGRVELLFTLALLTNFKNSVNII
jgi:hypothetical protein